MSYLKGIVIIITCWVNSVNADTIYDEARDRTIPIEITFPKNIESCSTKLKCPVAFLSAGYGVSHSKYTFLSKQFNQLGYLVIAISHELPSDLALSVSGDLYETRSENWSRGAETLNLEAIDKIEQSIPFNIAELPIRVCNIVQSDHLGEDVINQYALVLENGKNVVIRHVYPPMSMGIRIE